MPIIHIQYTTGELAIAAIEEARRLSVEILALADLKVKPLDPGESPDARRHRIAKLGKRLAESFQAIDAIMNVIAEHQHGARDVTANPPGEKPDDPGAN